MRAARTGNVLSLTFSFLESRLLQHAISEIVLSYKTKPEDLAPKVSSALYSTRGCKTAKMSAEETREWVENLRQYKSANVERLVNWSRSLDTPKAGQRQMKIKLDEAHILLTALNDHRLLLAARHDIGQKEMDMRSLAALAGMEPAQQTAVSIIHFLALIIEEILQFLPGNPGSWMESA